MGLEEEFGINVEEESAQSIATVQDAADLIEKLIEKKDAQKKQRNPELEVFKPYLASLSSLLHVESQAFLLQTYIFLCVALQYFLSYAWIFGFIIARAQHDRVSLVRVFILVN